MSNPKTKRKSKGKLSKDVVRMAVDQKWRCAYCRGKMNSDRASPLFATRDHVIPLSKMGAKGKQNIVIACRECNRMKGSLTAEQFRKAIAPPS